MVQLKLFEPSIINSACLVSPDSPRQAFYNLWMELLWGKYTVRKESGGLEKVFDRRLSKTLAKGNTMPNQQNTSSGTALLILLKRVVMLC